MKTFTARLRGTRRNAQEPLMLSHQELWMIMRAAARAITFYGTSTLDAETGHLINGRLADIFGALTLDPELQIAHTDTEWQVTAKLSVGHVRLETATQHTLRRCDVLDILQGAGRIGFRQGGTFHAALDGATHLSLRRQIVLDHVQLDSAGKMRVMTSDFALWNAAKHLEHQDDGTDAGRRQIAASNERRLLSAGRPA
jgi:hypothetical protein